MDGRSASPASAAAQAAIQPRHLCPLPKSSLRLLVHLSLQQPALLVARIQVLPLSAAAAGLPMRCLISRVEVSFGAADCSHVWSTDQPDAVGAAAVLHLPAPAAADTVTISFHPLSAPCGVMHWNVEALGGVCGSGAVETMSRGEILRRVVAFVRDSKAHDGGRLLPHPGLESIVGPYESSLPMTSLIEAVFARCTPPRPTVLTLALPAPGHAVASAVETGEVGVEWRC
eukprot:TRINITY_DN12642_c0_g1_i2.p1 TRINITY_DN12642_c0_g1~~TRINITY_DN12642_c0_g1_i2.p1  ORF type:complete len:244 (+),score=63.72 TRINITY_DN12642_c0_g1_i2:48-734(+)